MERDRELREGIRGNQFKKPLMGIFSTEKVLLINTDLGRSSEIMKFKLG